VSPSNGPSDWQEEYEALLRQNRRVGAHVEAAE
jgi:formate dehydrogenase major subunit